MSSRALQNTEIHASKMATNSYVYPTPKKGAIKSLGFVVCI